ncbi:polynucleotide adenylyltransferase PcnB [Bermanella marisrubri]|uniref:Poly(A) polymerase I n=1 Tax=Bermanella marisrubri TaxID=207949 RepID=Q1N0Z4_9GAMM|nr:polynucleotide adenylyltransferase PcnB [Bermanella marisrubri]EAT11880.1 tRNA nucleotidyltransferase/poly(A) polymerase [Oceanobacter sp. RED65] [Bermanella marisrubri]QIZ83043.1 polynucleotide adenylyltransferase PcnB [Bermanella marisrubri]
MLKRLINKLKKPQNNTVPQVEVIARSEHGISRTDISENALKVLYRLKKSGYEAHLVGGGVRDLLLGLHPKDFDVVTDASPEEVHKLFKNSRIIGRRFRLVHVTFGRDMIEVATFRGDHGNAEGKHQSKTNEAGMLLRDNVYGSIDEDAMRRDFTINALYYNIADFSVKSYAGGIDDIHAKRLRLIGDPETRYREDPVRMLRAARFAAKLGFSIDKSSKAPIKELAPLLRDIPPARLFEEVLKLFMAGYAKATFEQLQALGLFEPLFPHTQQCIDDNKFYRLMVMHALNNSDARVAQGKSLTPAFLFSVFLWPCVLETAKLLQQQGATKGQAMQQAMTQVISNQQARTAIPKRFAIPIREIWDLQHRLVARKPKQLETIASHNRFRAAYDFLLLREQSGEKLNQAGEFWTQFQNDHPELIRKAAPKKRSPQKRGSSYKGRGPRRRT